MCKIKLGTLSKDALQNFILDYSEYQNNGGTEHILDMLQKWNGIFGEEFMELRYEQKVYQNGEEILLESDANFIQSYDSDSPSYWEVLGVDGECLTEGTIYNSPKKFKD